MEDKIRLTPSTIFLAYMIAKNYIKCMKGTLCFPKRVQVAHVSVLIAAKIRERDIYCPLISHIICAGGKKSQKTTNMIKLKSGSIWISNKNWPENGFFLTILCSFVSF